MNFEDDKLHDECGVAGIFLKTSDTKAGNSEKKTYSGMNAATMVYYAL